MSYIIIRVSHWKNHVSSTKLWNLCHLQICLSIFENKLLWKIYKVRTSSRNFVFKGEIFSILNIQQNVLMSCRGKMEKKMDVNLNSTVFIGGCMHIWNSSTLATSCEGLTHCKRPWCWEGLGAEGEADDRGWDGWMASLTRWAWVWVNSESWWWTGRPGVLRFTGSQRVGYDWVSDWTELNWTELNWWISLLHGKTFAESPTYSTTEIKSHHTFS